MMLKYVPATLDGSLIGHYYLFVLSFISFAQANDLHNHTHTTWSAIHLRQLFILRRAQNYTLHTVNFRKNPTAGLLEL